MRIASALLADFASVREGLLFVIGGGIGVLRAEYPAPMVASLAVIVQLEPAEVREGELLTWPMELTIRSSRKTIGGLKGQLQGSLLNPDLPGQIPLAIDLRAFTLAKAGVYVITLKIGPATARLRLDALPLEKALTNKA